MSKLYFLLSVYTDESETCSMFFKLHKFTAKGW